MLTEYLQGIYVSDINTAFDKIIYQKYNIDIVINCIINDHPSVINYECATDLVLNWWDRV